MKKLYSTLIAAALCLAATSSASAVTIDGNLSDWGVTPFTDWSTEMGNYYIHNNIYAPGSVHDTNDAAYDIEWGGIYANQQGVYIAMVLSDANVWEDMAIAINRETGYSFGIDLTGLNGNTTGAVQNKNIYQITDPSQWDHEHYGYYPNDPFQILQGAQLKGQAQFAFKNIGVTEPGEYMGGGINYIMEGFFSWAALGIAAPDQVGFHWAEVSCMRDAIRVDTAVPEPGTMLLLGSGLVGLAVRRRRIA